MNSQPELFDDNQENSNVHRLAKELEEEIGDSATLKMMNERHAFIHSYHGSPAVMRTVFDPIINAERYEFVEPSAIIQIYCNQVVQTSNGMMELGKWWLKNADRREYEGIIFDPDLPSEHKKNYNTYKGMGVVAKPGDWSLINKHIKEILCNNDDVKYDYVMKWFCWAVQNPGKPAEVALVFKGKQGAGKGVILNQFVRIFGSHGISVSNAEHFTGKFNDHLMQTCFLFVDEAYNPGDREAESVLKNIITEPRLAIEAKFRSVKVGKNCLKIVMASNDEWIVPVSADSRRFFINEVDNRYAKSMAEDAVRQEYFKGIYHQINNGGIEAMLADLMSFELGDWHPRNSVPMTEEMEKQKIISLVAHEKFMLYLGKDGIFPGIKTDHGEYHVSFPVLRDYMGEMYPELKKIKKAGLDRMLSTLGILEHKPADQAINMLVFPSLAEYRNRWKAERLPGASILQGEPSEWRIRGNNKF